jgi:hypothetical protein
MPVRAQLAEVLYYFIDSLLSDLFGGVERYLFCKGFVVRKGDSWDHCSGDGKSEGIATGKFGDRNGGFADRIKLFVSDKGRIDVVDGKFGRFSEDELVRDMLAGDLRRNLTFSKTVESEVLGEFGKCRLFKR